MLQFLDQLDQRQTRLGLLGLVAKVGNRKLETRGYYLRKFSDNFLAKERVTTDEFGVLKLALEGIDKGAGKRLGKRVSPWVFAAERWIADPRLLSGTLSIDEDRTGVFLDLARRLGIISNTYSLTELGVVLQDLVVEEQRSSGDDNPLLVCERIGERAFFTLVLLLADAVTPFYLRSLADNAHLTRAERKTELQCLPQAVSQLLEHARQGAGISHALAVRSIMEYRDRLQSENAAWHNARPRIEFYIDLGLLEPHKTEGYHALTDAGLRAVDVWEPLIQEPRRGRDLLDAQFFGWFATIHDLSLTPLADDRSQLSALYRAFRKPIARPIGNTPARTLALTACIDSLRDGKLIEIGALLHTLRSAAHGEWGSLISFSGGSRLDNEFLVRFDARTATLLAHEEQR